MVVNLRKSTTLREAMSLLAVEDPDIIPRSVSMSVKSVFVRSSSGKLAHKDLGIVCNFKVSKDENKTLQDLGFQIGDFLWINTVKGGPQKSIIGSAKAMPRAEVLNKTVQSKDFGIVHRSRATPYERLGNQRMDFRNNRSRAYDGGYNERRHKDRMDSNKSSMRERYDKRENDKRDNDKFVDQKISEDVDQKGDDGW